MKKYCYKHVGIVGLCALMLAVMGMYGASTAQARTITVPLAAGSGQKNLPTTIDEARAVAFKRAVWEETLAIVGNDLSGARKALLREHIASRTQLFVQGYSGLTREATDSGSQIRIDVEVNLQELKRALRSMGMTRSRQTPIGYSLTLSGPKEAWQELGKLQILYNTRVEQAAPVTLFLQRTGALWTGQMGVAGGRDVASGSSLTEVWESLWEKYFLGTLGGGVSTGGSGVLMLHVRGWSLPDGVIAFDKDLDAQSSGLGTIALVKVEMRPAGISAQWALHGINRAAFEARLKRMFSGKNLVWSLYTE